MKNWIAPAPLAAVPFLAGSTESKTGPIAEQLSHDAKQYGLKAHMRRLNSHQRLRTPECFGRESADGTYLAFIPEKNLARLTGWLDELDATPSLFAGDAA